MTRVLHTLLAAAMLLACGNTTDASIAAAGWDGGAAGAGSVAGSGGFSGAGGVGWGGETDPCGEGEWQACGVAECPTMRPGCSLCAAAGEGLVSACIESVSVEDVYYKPADGNLFLALDSDVSVSAIEVPFEATQVVTRFGGGERLAYADRGLWTGAALPTPISCPPPSAGVQLCGGGCGGCPSDQLCTGRSPKHPWGICVDIDAFICAVGNTTNKRCASGEGCFSFVVEPEHQAFANETGFCMSKAVCTETADVIPGGGLCDGV